MRCTRRKMLTESERAFVDACEKTARDLTTRDLVAIIRKLEGAYAELEKFMGVGEPWDTLSAASRLVEASDHLLYDHNCNGHGREELVYATDAIRQRIAAYRGKLEGAK